MIAIAAELVATRDRNGGIRQGRAEGGRDDTGLSFASAMAASKTRPRGRKTVGIDAR